MCGQACCLSCVLKYFVFQHQYKSVQKHVDRLISENDRLTTELHQTLEARLPALTNAALPLDSELTAIDNLQTQLSLISQVGPCMYTCLVFTHEHVHLLSDVRTRVFLTKFSIFKRQ